MGAEQTELMPTDDAALSEAAAAFEMARDAVSISGTAFEHKYYPHASPTDILRRLDAASELLHRMLRTPDYLSAARQPAREAASVPVAEWLIWSCEHDGWWAPGRRGYTSKPSEAGLYTFEEASEVCADSFGHMKRNKPDETMLLAAAVQSARSAEARG